MQQSPPGQAASVAVGTVTPLAAGVTPSVTNTGTSSAAVLNFAIPAGQPGTNGTNGAPGVAGSVAVGTVTPLAAGATPTVTNTGTPTAAVLAFGIPMGASGGITAAQALTSAQDGAIATSQSTGSGDLVANSLAQHPAPNLVFTAGPSLGILGRSTLFPLADGSVIHDTVPGTEGNRYKNCPTQLVLHNVLPVGIPVDGSHCRYDDALFDTGAPTDSYGNPTFGFRSLQLSSLRVLGKCYNYSGTWCSSALRQDYVAGAGRGIQGWLTLYMFRHAIGDINVLNQYIWWDAGWKAESDEGVTGIRNYIQQNFTYWHGTSLSAGTGLTLPLLSDSTEPVSGAGEDNNHTTDGGILLDITKGTLAGTITGGASSLAGSGFLSTYPVAGVTVPVVTSWGICNTALPIPSSPQANISRTCTVTLQKGTFAVGGLVWVAGAKYFEQAPITAVGTAAGGTQSITISVRHPHPAAANVFQGGTVGQYFSSDADYAQQRFRTTYPVFGSLDGVSLIFGYYASGGTNSIAMPGCNAQAFCPGAAGRNGFHLYPGAEIIANHSQFHDPELEPNGIVFANGDLLESPQPDSAKLAGQTTICGMVTPVNGGGSGCHLTQIVGAGVGPNFYPHVTVNLNPASFYDVYGGNVTGPPGHYFQGYYHDGLRFDYAPGEAIIKVTAINAYQFGGDQAHGNHSTQLFALPHGRISWDDDSNLLSTDHIGSVDYLGPGNAPSGGCTNWGAWSWSMDGKASWCNVGTETQPFDYAGAAAAAQAASAQKSANLSDLASASTARTNLGLGAAATHGATVTVNGTPCTLDGTCIITKPWSVQPALNGGGSALAAKAYPQTAGYNDTGQAVTITGIRCHADTGASTMAVARWTLSGGTPQKVADLLASPVACGTGLTLGTQSATTTLAAGDWLVFTFTADGTSTQMAGVVTGTHP